ncbi:MAG: hypothetical protein LAO08_03750 [Acidobacteriia bacterium]|nr:hypothetical protein [Terriglobia bacterium]
MKKHDIDSRQARRNFLKAAGGAAAGLIAAKDSFGKSAQLKSTMRKDHLPAAPPDRGLWITWYDLPANGREDYFSWLHATYLPAILKRPGYLWAAHYASMDLEGGAANATRYHHVDDPRVGKGFHYMLLIAATDANVFGDPVPSVLHAALPEQGKKMLAMRMGERVNLFTETGRREGQASAAYKEGMLGAPCIQVGSFDCELEFEEEMHAGYVLQRLPKMCATPSCVRVRKLNSVAGWAKHGIVYEFASKEGFDRDYAPAVANSPLGFGAHSVVPNLIHAPNGPNSALRIWPPVPKA